MKYRVIWKINPLHGRGKAALDYATAKAWVDEMNAKYGQGTHQLVAEEEKESP